MVEVVQQGDHVAVQHRITKKEKFTYYREFLLFSGLIYCFLKPNCNALDEEHLILFTH